MKLTRKQAAKLVDAALSTLWERRPFKWDLAKMMFEVEDGEGTGETTQLWDEMMLTMEDDVIEAAAKLRVQAKVGKSR